MAALALVKGTLDALVLKTLSWGAMHSFEIASWLDEQSDGRLGIEDSALYQALHRLEERGFITATWGLTENNRRARYYALAAKGRARLREDTEHWLSYADVVTAILTLSRRAGAT